MDIHRSRFVPYPSSAINALAFSSTDHYELGNGGPKNLRLAVGRANGDIEIWNPSMGNWVQETVFHGGKDRSVEGLQWVQEPNDYDKDGKVTSIGQLRLFSIGYSSTVTEWDLSTGLPLRQSTGNHSEVWCFAAQPRMNNADSMKAAALGTPRGQDIVVGCADGSIALLTTADNELHFRKFVARSQSSKVRILSIDFKDRNTVVVGYANSCFRIYDIRASSMVRNVSLGAGPKSGPRELLVWAIRCLPNGDIITGDSAGEIRFFDGTLYSQYQRLKAHDADILDIATSRDGKTIFSAGMDRKTTILSKSAVSGRQYEKSTHLFYHNHDVKALARFDGNQLSFLASGGLDTNLEIVPINNFGEEYHRGLPGLPQIPPVASSSAERLIASWYGQEVSIWRLKVGPSTENSERIHRLVAKIALKGDENIANASLSQNGRILAVSTASETRLFSLSADYSSRTDGLKVQKLDTKQTVPGGRFVQMSPNSKWLSIITQSNNVVVHRLIAPSDETEHLRIIPQSFKLERINREEKSTALRAYRRTISRQQFSPDSKLLVVTDLSGFTDCWKLQGEEDATAPEVEMTGAADNASDASSSDSEDEEDDIKVFGQTWISMEASKTLPTLDSAALLVSFRPRRKRGRGRHGTEDGMLVVVNGLPTSPGVDNQTPEEEEDKYEVFILTANHRLYEFDLSSGKLTNWSRRNTTDCLPSAFQQIKDRAMGCFWHTSPESQRLYLYGSNWVFMFDVAQDFDPEEESGLKKQKESLIETPQKRKRAGESGAGDKMRDEDIRGFKPLEPSKASKKRKLEQQAATTANGVTNEEEEEEMQPSRRLKLRQTAESELNGVSNGLGNGIVAARKPDAPRNSWHSFAYRPILAMLPLSEENEFLETVLIERPLWELDLPPRLMGAHDRSL